ncbi:MAG: MlaE family lipid ABC transporter permease subunit [Myxococcota bacterium]|nr:MlaE family lipid ABC transporter permease subunit [Myxococcota bacterium]
MSLRLHMAKEGSMPVVRFEGALNRHTVPQAYKTVGTLLSGKGPAVFDLSGVQDFDSAAAAFLGHCFMRLGSGPQGLHLANLPSAVAHSLEGAAWDYRVDTPLVVEPQSPFVESVGSEAAAFGQQVYYFVFLLSELFFAAVIAPFRGRLPRLGPFLEQLSRIGAGSAPIVLLVALLVGLTTALQAAYQLRQFGANIYIADLVGISMMRELGPLMAAILVAGRSGAAITAEIGTMKVNEELDALRLLGLSPIEYLGVPRVLAASVTQPLLGVAGAITGIAGGFIIALTVLDLNYSAYYNESLTAVFVADVAYCLYKSAVFGWIIVVVGLYYGFRVEGGAEGVGRATTNSVVMSIFLIIIADCAFSFI